LYYARTNARTTYPSIFLRAQGAKRKVLAKKKGVTWVVQATTPQRNPGCTEKRILVQDQDGGNAQHGKERTQHHKHLQKGLSERFSQRIRRWKKKKGVTRVAKNPPPKDAGPQDPDFEFVVLG
jgi:hypothetical protein